MTTSEFRLPVPRGITKPNADVEMIDCDHCKQWHAVGSCPVPLDGAIPKPA